MGDLFIWANKILSILLQLNEQQTNTMQDMSYVYENIYSQGQMWVDK